jgi:N6-adenosine-specific RNA methylase IME4
MDLRAIRSLPMSRLAKPDCVMLLWAIGPMLPEAIETLRGWGFTYKSNLVWRKTGANGRPKPGLGWWARSMHEQVLIGTIGEPFKLLDAAFPSVFDGEAREHSRKPESFYQMVEERMPGCERADLFGRATRRGWRSWGLEATKFDEAAE